MISTLIHVHNIVILLNWWCENRVVMKIWNMLSNQSFFFLSWQFHENTIRPQNYEFHLLFLKISYSTAHNTDNKLVSNSEENKL